LAAIESRSPPQCAGAIAGRTQEKEDASLHRVRNGDGRDGRTARGRRGPVTVHPAPATEVTAALDNVEKAKSYRHVTKMTFDGKTMFEMRIYKQGDRMRFEGGKDISIVVDEKGNAIQFDHANKTVTRLDLDKSGKDAPKPSEEVKGLTAKLRD